MIAEAARSDTVEAPYVGKLPRQMITSSDYELIRKIKSEFSFAWEAQSKDFKRLFLAWKMVFGLEGEQWDDEAKNYKEERGQRVAQYNLLGPQMRKLHGALIQATYDFHYDPVYGKRNSGVVALEDAYYVDKEICHYDENYNLIVKDGIVHLGVLCMKIKRDEDGVHRIFFEREIPGRWLFDPYWKDRYDKNCRKSWKHGNSTIEDFNEILTRMPSSPEYDRERKKAKKMPTRWTEPKMDEYETDLPIFDDTYHWIEPHWIEEVHKKRLRYINSEGKAILFPVTEDREELQQFAEMNGIGDEDWSFAEVEPYDDKIHKSALICTNLWPYKLLDYGKPEIQTKSLPTIQFTFERDIAGRNKGNAYDLIDPQKDINYNKGKVQEFLANAFGGAMVYNKLFFGNDETRMQEFEENHNDTTRAFPVDGPIRDFMSHVNPANIPPELIRQSNEAIEYMDRQGIPAAMQAQTQRSGEPAKLFEDKIKIATVGNAPVQDNLKYVRRRQSEMFFLQSKITYSGAPRQFSSADGKRQAYLNYPTQDNQGLPVILNKVEDIPRCSVSITEAVDNLNRVERTRMEMGSMLPVLEQNPEERAIAIHELLMTLKLPADKKDALEEASRRSIELAKLNRAAEAQNMMTTILNDKLMGEQAKMQLMQILGATQGQQDQDVPEQMSAEQPAQQPVPELEGGEGESGAGAMAPQKEALLPQQTEQTSQLL